MPRPSQSRRSQSSHAQTLNGLPDPHKPTKSRYSPAGSFFTSFFATFSHNATTTGVSHGPSGPCLKTHGSEVELRREYLSPEREKEIGEIWETFKRQSQDMGEDTIISFPRIMEYDYDDTEDDRAVA